MVMTKVLSNSSGLGEQTIQLNCFNLRAVQRKSNICQNTLSVTGKKNFGVKGGWWLFRAIMFRQQLAQKLMTTEFLTFISPYGCTSKFNYCNSWAWTAIFVTSNPLCTCILQKVSLILATINFMIKFKVTKRHLKNVALGALTSCNDDA